MKNRFDIVADQWDNNLRHIERTKSIANEIIKIIGTNHYGNAMEYGAGTGLLSFELKDYFSHITLIDNSKKMLRVANQKITNEKINHFDTLFLDLENNTYCDKKFDFIFTQMTLHHIKNIDILLEKFYILLNTKGTLAIADLYEEDGTFHDEHFCGHHGFNPQHLSALLKTFGFININYKPCFIIKKTISNGTLKEFPLFLLHANKS